MFYKILVPFNNSPDSLGILPCVTHLSKSLDLTVVLMAAVDPEAVETSQEISTSEVGDQSILSAEVQAADENRQFLRRFIELLEREGIKTQSAVVIGEDAADEILRYAEEHECDIIALEAEDRNLLTQAVKGSIPNDVMRSASVPVLAITPKNDSVSIREQVSLSTILVPLDGSPFAETVLPYVEYLARELSLEVILVRALQVTDIYPPLAGAPVTTEPGSVQVELMADEAAEETATKYLEDIAAGLSAKGLNIQWRPARGDTAGNLISDLAQELPNNMIALASHGRSGLARWVLGSVAEDLVKHTGDPVLVIPSGMTGDDED